MAGRILKVLVVVMAAVLSAAAMDICLSLLRGYILRTDLPLLLAVDLLMVGLVAVPALALLCATRWLPLVPPVYRRAPRATVLLAAWAPVGLLRVRHLAEDPLSLGPECVLLILILALGVLETRRPARPLRPAEPALAALVAAMAIWAAVSIPLPGRSMLNPPSAAPAAAATAEQPNLLLIVLDTTRQDHLGLYGHGADTTPFLDRLAEISTVFDRAVAASAWTLPSHATLFTGLYPRSHGTDAVEDEEGIDVSEVPRLDDPMHVRPLAEEAHTLAELAQEAGMETGAICGNVAYLYNIFRLDQGFVTYVDEVGIRTDWVPAGFRLAEALQFWRFWPYQRAIYRNTQSDRHAGEVTRLATEWLSRRRDRRFALFLNYIDPHDPYFPPWSYARRFPQADRPVRIDRDAIRAGERDIRDDEAGPALDAYDAEIRYMDDQLGVLFERLADWDLLDTTLVVIVGDHGESFGDHHNFRHGNNVYENEIRVPMIVRRPGQQEGARSQRLVHLVDVLPTVVKTLHLERPPVLQGDGLFVDQRTHPVVAFTGASPGLGKDFPRYLRHHRAVYQGDWKLIADSQGEVELYDVAADSAELSDEAARHPEQVEALARELQRFLLEVRPMFKTSAADIDEETVRRLRALGYLE